MNRLAMIVGVLLATAACTERQPTSPTGDAFPGSSPRLQSAHHTLTGTVFESTADGTRPLSDVSISFWVEPGGMVGGTRVDASGRYRIPNLPHASRVLVGAVDPYASIRGPARQLCAVTATMAGDTVRDVELVRGSTGGLTRGSPTLSGLVFTNSDEGRKPAVGVPLTYKIGCTGMQVVYGTTDRDGRYEFCRMPPGSGCVTAVTRHYENEEWESPYEDRQTIAQVDVRGDTVLDINVPR